MSQRHVPGWEKFLTRGVNTSLLARFGTPELNLNFLVEKLTSMKDNWLFLSPEATMRDEDFVWPDEAVKLYKVVTASIREPDRLELHNTIPYYLSFDENGLFVNTVAPYRRSKNTVIGPEDLPHAYLLKPKLKLAATGVTVND